MKYIKKDERLLPYEIVIKKNKHTYFRIKDGYVLVTTNKKMKHLVKSYLLDHFDSLYKKVERIKVNIDENMLMLNGQTFLLEFYEGLFRYTKLRDKIIVYGKDLESAKKKIYLQEVKQMMVDIHPKVLKVIKNKGLTELPIIYKYLKSKFGSYHRKHDEITINTVLACYEPIYLEYVLFHEYAHKLVFNHSKDFYDILDTWMPGHKNIQKTLKKMAIR